MIVSRINLTTEYLSYGNCKIVQAIFKILFKPNIFRKKINREKKIYIYLKNCLNLQFSAICSKRDVHTFNNKSIITKILLKVKLL